MDNSTPDMSEKLVQYLDGELSGPEKEGLEHKLSTDIALQDELESLKTTREAIRQFGLQQQVAGIHRQAMQEMQMPVRKINSSRRILRYGLAVAASLILIIGGYLAYNFYTLSPNKVFSANYHSYELTTMRDDDTVQVSLIEKSYRGKKYKEVAAMNPATIKEIFLVAMSHLELGDNSKAIEGFKQVIGTNEAAKTTIMKDEAEYYLALSYVRNKDFDFALEWLRKIKDDPNHTYHQQITRKLIRQVKMLKWR